MNLKCTIMIVQTETNIQAYSLSISLPPSLYLSLSLPPCPLSSSLQFFISPSLSLYLPSFLSLNKFMLPSGSAISTPITTHELNQVLCWVAKWRQRKEIKTKQFSDYQNSKTGRLVLLTRGMLGFEMANRAPDPVPNLSGLSTSWMMWPCLLMIMIWGSATEQDTIGDPTSIGMCCSCFTVTIATSNHRNR